MVRELITGSKERNDRDRQAAKEVDEGLGTHYVGVRVNWHFVWSLNCRMRETCPTL